MYRARHTPSTVALDNGIFPYDTEALAEKVQQLRRVRNDQAGTIKALRAQLIRKQEELARAHHKIAELQLQQQTAPGLFGPEASQGGGAPSQVYKQVARLQDALARKQQEADEWRSKASELDELREKVAIYEAELARQEAMPEPRRGSRRPGSHAASGSVATLRSAVSAARPASARSRRRVYVPSRSGGDRPPSARPRSAASSRRPPPWQGTSSGPALPRQAVGSPKSPVFDTYFDVVPPPAPEDTAATAAVKRRRAAEAARYEGLVRRQDELEAQLDILSPTRPTDGRSSHSGHVASRPSIDFETGSQVHPTSSARRYGATSDPELRVLEAVARTRYEAAREEEAAAMQAAAAEVAQRRHRRRRRRRHPVGTISAPDAADGHGTVIKPASGANRKRIKSPDARRRAVRRARMQALQTQEEQEAADARRRAEHARKSADKQAAREARRKARARKKAKRARRKAREAAAEAAAENARAEAARKEQLEAQRRKERTRRKEEAAARDARRKERRRTAQHQQQQESKGKEGEDERGYSTHASEPAVASSSPVPQPAVASSEPAVASQTVNSPWQSLQPMSQSSAPPSAAGAASQRYPSNRPAVPVRSGTKRVRSVATNSPGRLTRPATLGATPAAAPIRVARGGLFHLSWSSSQNDVPRLNRLSDVFDAAARGQTMVDAAALDAYLQARVASHNDAAQRYNALQEASPGVPVPRDAVLQGTPLTHSLFCTLLCNGGPWPATMTLEQYLPVADAAFRAGSGPDSSPPASSADQPSHVPTQQRPEQQQQQQQPEQPPAEPTATRSPQSEARGNVGDGRSDEPNAAGTAVEDGEEAAKEALEAAEHRIDPIARPLAVHRGGLWHCSLCAPESSARLQAVLAAVWDDAHRVDGSSAASPLAATQLVEFLRHEASQVQDGADASAVATSELSAKLACKFLSQSVQDWPATMSWQQFLPVAHGMFTAGARVPSRDVMRRLASRPRKVVAEPRARPPSGASFAAPPEGGRPSGRAAAAGTPSGASDELLQRLRAGHTDGEDAHSDGADGVSTGSSTTQEVEDDAMALMDDDDEMDVEMEAEAAEIIQRAYRSYSSRRLRVDDGLSSAPPQQPRAPSPRAPSPPPSEAGGVSDAGGMTEDEDGNEGFTVRDTGELDGDDDLSVGQRSAASSVANKATAVVVVQSVHGLPTDVSNVDVAFSFLGHDNSDDVEVTDGAASIQLTTSIPVGSGGERAMFLSMLQQLDDDDYEDSDGVIKFHVSDATTGAPIGTAELLAGPFKLLIRDEQDIMGAELPVRAFGEDEAMGTLVVSVFASEACQHVLFGPDGDESTVGDDSDTSDGIEF